MRNYWASKVFGISVLALATVHCSSSSSDDGGGSGGGTGTQCADISGTWSVTGTCPANGNCAVSQTGCTASFACDFGITTAAVSGTSVSFDVQGAPCTGTVGNQQLNASCTTSSGSCTASATCTSGTCGAGSGGTGGAGTGGSGGSGTGGTSGDPLQQKCSQMCDAFLAPPLDSCGKDFSSNPEKCDSECYQHVTSQGGQPPEATESQLDCAIAAADCDAWAACSGDLL